MYFKHCQGQHCRLKVTPTVPAENDSYSVFQHRPAGSSGRQGKDDLLKIRSIIDPRSSHMFFVFCSTVFTGIMHHVDGPISVGTVFWARIFDRVRHRNKWMVIVCSLHRAQWIQSPRRYRC